MFPTTTHQAEIDAAVERRRNQLISVAAPAANADIAKHRDQAAEIEAAAARIAAEKSRAFRRIEQMLEDIGRVQTEIELLNEIAGIAAAHEVNAGQAIEYFLASRRTEDVFASRNYDALTIEMLRAQMLAPAVPSQVAHRKATLEAARREIAEISEAHRIDVLALLVELKASRPVFAEVVWPR